jgi:hypothetical protein
MPMLNGKKIPYTPEGMKFFAKQKAAAKTGDASKGDLVYRPKGAKTAQGRMTEDQYAAPAKRAAIKKKMSGGK